MPILKRVRQDFSFWVGMGNGQGREKGRRGRKSDFHEKKKEEKSKWPVGAYCESGGRGKCKEGHKGEEGEG